MPPSTADQALSASFDVATQSIKVLASGGGTPPTTTLVRDSDTGGAAIDKTTAFAKKWAPGKVTVHADAAVTSLLTIKFKSLTGAAYETKILEVDPGWTDIYFNDFQAEDVYANGDELHIECANVGAATIALDITGHEVP